MIDDMYLASSVWSLCVNTDFAGSNLFIAFFSFFFHCFLKPTWTLPFPLQPLFCLKPSSRPRRLLNFILYTINSDTPLRFFWLRHWCSVTELSIHASTIHSICTIFLSVFYNFVASTTATNWHKSDPLHAVSIALFCFATFPTPFWYPFDFHGPFACITILGDILIRSHTTMLAGITLCTYLGRRLVWERRIVYLEVDLLAVLKAILKYFVIILSPYVKHIIIFTTYCNYLFVVCSLIGV